MAQQPNIIVFMTDQERYDTIYPYEKAITPNFSQLAQQSTVFTQAFSSAPHCCPARASFFSGLYPSEHGVWNNVDVGNTLSRGLNDNVTLFPQLLSKHGYKCCYSGKWHVSAEQSPADCGFEDVYNFGIKYSKQPKQPNTFEWDWYYKNADAHSICDDNTIRQDGQVVRNGYPIYNQYGNSDDPYNDGVIVQNAIKMMEQKDDRPLFLFVGVLGPHDPYIPPKQFEELYDIDKIQLPDSFYDSMDDKPNLYKRIKQVYDLTPDEHRKSILKYLAFCSYEDHLLGKLIQASKSLEGDTVFIALSDHGDYCGEHGLWAKGLPCFDGAYHIPLIIHDSRLKKQQLCDEFVSITDLAPTILKLAGISETFNCSGYSLTQLTQDGQWPRQYVCTQTNGNELYGIQRSIKNKKYKLVYNGFDFDEFYDLQKDPDEMHNEINNEQYRDVIKEMYRNLWQFAYEHKDTCINPYIMVGLAKYGPGIIFKK